MVTIAQADRPPVPREYEHWAFFFDRNSTRISPVGDVTLKQVERRFACKYEYCSPWPGQVFIVGHTDTGEAPTKSMALALERAEVAKRRLAELGVPADRIVALGMGDTRPIIPTAKGVLEIQNRRVEIEFHPPIYPAG